MRSDVSHTVSVSEKLGNSQAQHSAQGIIRPSIFASLFGARRCALLPVRLGPFTVLLPQH